MYCQTFKENIRPDIKLLDPRICNLTKKKKCLSSLLPYGIDQKKSEKPLLILLKEYR